MEEARHLLTHYLSKNGDSMVSLRTLSWSWAGRRSTRKTIHKELLTIHPLPAPSREDLTPKRAMWNAYAADYTPSNNPSHAACTPPRNATLPPAIRAAAKHDNRLVSSTIIRFATGYCFDADYSDRFRTGADNPTLCPCSEGDHPPPSSQEGPQNGHPRHIPPQRHTRRHVILRCPIPTLHRTRYISALVTSVAHILRSEDHTCLLCSFLRESRSTLLKPLPVLRPGRDPPDQ